MDGGAGTDSASYYDGTVGVVVDLAAGTGKFGDAEGDTLVGIENVTGSQGNDTPESDRRRQYPGRLEAATTCSAAAPGPTRSTAASAAIPPPTTPARRV